MVIFETFEWRATASMLVAARPVVAIRVYALSRIAVVVSAERGRPRRAAASPSDPVLPFAMAQLSSPIVCRKPTGLDRPENQSVSASGGYLALDLAQIATPSRMEQVLLRRKAVLAVYLTRKLAGRCSASLSLLRSVKDLTNDAFTLETCSRISISARHGSRAMMAS